jgi:hypothetical protein
MQEN